MMDPALIPVSKSQEASHMSSRVKLEKDMEDFSGKGPGEIPNSPSRHHLHPDPFEVKIKRETMYCLHCPYNDESIVMSKLHMFLSHPANAAVVSNNFLEASYNHPDVTFFCVKETCSFATSVCNLYEKHLTSCCPLHITLSEIEGERLKSTLIFVIEFHSKHCLPPSIGFPQFISSFIKACTEKDDPSSKTFPLLSGERVRTQLGNEDGLVSRNVDMAVKGKDRKISPVSLQTWDDDGDKKEKECNVDNGSCFRHYGQEMDERTKSDDFTMKTCVNMEGTNTSRKSSGRRQSEKHSVGNLEKKIHVCKVENNTLNEPYNEDCNHENFNALKRRIEGDLPVKQDIEDKINRKEMQSMRMSLEGLKKHIYQTQSERGSAFPTLESTDCGAHSQLLQKRNGHSDTDTLSQPVAKRFKSEMNVQEQSGLQKSDDSQECFEINKARQVDEAMPAVGSKQDDGNSDFIIRHKLSKTNIMTTKRTCLTMEQKLKIIEEMESGPDQSFAETARKHGVSRSVISRLWKTREETRSTAKYFQNLSRKRKTPFKEEEVDIALNTWLCKKKAKNARINGPILKQKAQQLAEEMGHDFTPSDGWLSRFKERHGITFKREYNREKQSTDFESAQKWRDRVIVGLLNDYSPDDIYNAHETGVFFKAHPDRGFVNRNKKISGGKTQKDRLSVLICANMSGTDKKKLLIIGKNKSPHGFPRNVSKLPVDYKHSDNAWMTSAIFTDFLQSWDKSLRPQGRSIVLFVSNSRVHPTPIGLTCIKVEFVPPNTTATLQSMDKGIIRKFKCHYRAALNSIITSELDSDESKKASDILRTITVLRAIYLMEEAWSLVTSETIKNCYKKAGFVIKSTSDNVSPIITPVTFTPPENLDPEIFEEFIAVDDDAPMTGELTDGEIVQNTLQRKRPRAEVEEECAEDEEEVETTTKMPSSSELLQSLNTIRVFMESAGLTSQTKFEAITRAVQESVISNRKQSSLTDFFLTK